jgi:hypothetical protein
MILKYLLRVFAFVFLIAIGKNVYDFGPIIFHYVLTCTLVIHTLRAVVIFGIPKWTWRLPLGHTLFSILGVGLYLIWVRSSLNYWSFKYTLPPFTTFATIGRDLFWVVTYLINLLGLGIHIKYGIHNALSLPAEP